MPENCISINLRRDKCPKIRCWVSVQQTNKHPSKGDLLRPTKLYNEDNEKLVTVLIALSAFKLDRACCRKNEQPTVVLDEMKDRHFRTFLSDDDADKMALSYVPKSTEKSTKWVLHNFKEWREVRNWRFPENPVPSDLLTSTNVDCTVLCEWLSHFIAETRNGKGE